LATSPLSLSEGAFCVGVENGVTARPRAVALRASIHLSQRFMCQQKTRMKRIFCWH